MRQYFALIGPQAFAMRHGLHLGMCDYAVFLGHATKVSGLGSLDDLFALELLLDSGYYTVRIS